MQLKEFAKILEDTRGFVVAQNDFYYKEVLVEILDALAWIIRFLVKFSLDEIVADLLANLIKKPTSSQAHGSNSNFSTLGDINVETSQKENTNDSSKQSILDIIRNIVPYIWESLHLVHKLYDCYSSGKKENLDTCVNNKTLDRIARGLQCVGYVLKFGFLVYGFCVVLSAEKSNLTKENRDELKKTINDINELIEKANSEFEQKSWIKFEGTSRLIYDKVDDMRERILKLEFNIKDKMYSLKETKDRAQYSGISSVIGAAINVIDIARDPKCVLPYALLGLDAIIGVGSVVTIKMSIDSLKDFQKSLEELEHFREVMKLLRDIQTKKYLEYTEKQ